MSDYLENLAEQFKSLPIDIVGFDNGNTPPSMAAYIIVRDIPKEMLKDKGSTALDLGNYIYRSYGIRYQHPPEYHRSGEAKNTLAFYISKSDMESMPHIQEWLVKVYNSLNPDSNTKRWASALYNHRIFRINPEE